MPVNDPTLPSHRRPELDFLRGIAIVLVLGRHMQWVSDLPSGFVQTFFSAWKRIGWIGVDLFFVLSGFLVGGLLLREGRIFGAIQPGRFLLRRALRIYPAFYIFLFLSVGLCYALGMRFAGWPKAFYSELLFLQNYIPSLWPQTWSLAVEEHFYILLLCLLLGLVKSNPAGDPFRALPKFILCVNVAVLAGRFVSTYIWHTHWWVLYFQTQWRIDALLFGVLLAYGVDRHFAFMVKMRERIHPWRFIGWSLLFIPNLLLQLNKDSYIVSFGFTALYLGFGWLLIDLLLHEPVINAKRATWFYFLAWIGRHSYSIYLWHFTVYSIGSAHLRHKFGLDPWLPAETFGLVGLALGTGIAMSWLVEQPLMRWRNRRFPTRNTAIPEGAQHDPQ